MTELSEQFCLSEIKFMIEDIKIAADDASRSRLDRDDVVELITDVELTLKSIKRMLGRMPKKASVK